jgi:threonylcarbamoyladenosine tRNA methylthiotransferase MtaB
MQSGSDGVLRRMRRRWGSRRFIDRCRLVQERLDRPAITTDVIVGFPGETGAEFAETVAACREVGFSKIHMFPFSPRRGTPAATMPGQISKALKQERGRELAAVETELREAYFAKLRGMRLRVLVESPFSDPQRAGSSPTPASYVGTSCRYAPVEVQADGTQVGDFIDIIAGAAHDGRIAVQRGIGPMPANGRG